MKKITALAILAVLIMMLAFSPITVLADEIAPADHGQTAVQSVNNPETGDLSESVAALFVLCAGGILTTVSWKKELI